MSDGIIVRAWRYLFARESHAECLRAIEQERLARQWEREALIKLLQETMGKTLEMADPGLNYRFHTKPNNAKKPPVKVELEDKNSVEMLPGLN